MADDAFLVLNARFERKPIGPGEVADGGIDDCRRPIGVAVDASHFVMTGGLPVVIVGLHDVAGKAGLGLVGKAVGQRG